MSELDLDALEQAARDAGGGRWFSTGWTVGSRGFEVGDLKSRERICSDAPERCAEFIAAANPATILELLARLEAAEKERDALRNEIAFVKEVEFPRKAQAVADAWKGKCKRLEVERNALRAKIEKMEQQEPVAWADAFGEPFRKKSEIDGVASPLYALPGAQAQPAPSAPREAIDKMLTQLMNIAVSNGANSISMPDEYVEVAAWLCGIPAQPTPSVPIVPSGLHPLETVRFWADAYTHPGDDNFRGHGMAAALLREYAELRAALAAAPEAKP